MIDSLELSIPDTTAKQLGTWADVPVKNAGEEQPYIKRASFLYDKKHPRKGPFPQALVFYGHKRPINREHRHHKVQFVRTSTLTEWDIFNYLGHLFVISSSEMCHLKVMRVDFAADVRSVPVQWFRENCYIPRKQSYQELRWVESLVRTNTTIMIGKRPDLYRIYDKVEDIKHRQKVFHHLGQITDKPEPTITRVERQCSGAAVPAQFRTLSGLLDGAADFDPFALLQFQPAPVMPDTQKWNPQKWLMCMGLKAAVEDVGQTLVRKRLNSKGARKGSRNFKKYSDLLQPSGKPLTNEMLKELYRRSTIRQLNQLRNGCRPLGGWMGELL